MKKNQIKATKLTRESGTLLPNVALALNRFSWELIEFSYVLLLYRYRWTNCVKFAENQRPASTLERSHVKVAR